MSKPSKEELFSLITADIVAKIIAKSREPISFDDFNAMTISSAKHRAGLVKDPLGWLNENRDIAPEDVVGTGKQVVAAALLNGFRETRNDLFVGQFAENFEEKFGMFCDLITDHLDTLEEQYADVGAALKDRFLSVVTAPTLQREALEQVVEEIKASFSSHWMSDERGAVTKAYKTFDKAIELGLLERVEFVPYAEKSNTPTYI